MNRHRLRRAVGRAGLYASVITLVSPAVLFFLWMLSLSLKNELDNTAYPPVFIPHPPTLANFIDVFAKNDFLTYTINSVIVSFSATGLALLFGVPAGYGIGIGIGLGDLDTFIGLGQRRDREPRPWRTGLILW